MSKRIDPIAKSVIDTLNTAYYQTQNFANNPNSAINGLLVSGDAGIGKSYFVKKALRDAGVQGNVEMLKGGAITAASLYVKLYLNRSNHRIVVFDDVDIIHHPEKNKIIPMILGAADTGRHRLVTWSTAKRNALMEEFDVPMEFTFDGNIIIITNHTKETIEKYARQWANAIRSRFTPSTCEFTREEKFAYTKHLILNQQMLGANCVDHKYEVSDKKFPGYPEEIIEQTVDYLDNNYGNISEVTPRLALQIADTIYYNSDPQLQKVLLGAFQ